MVKNIFFILPPSTTLASNYVRALCLEGFSPVGWKFRFIFGQKLPLDIRIFRGLDTIFYYAVELTKIKFFYRDSTFIYLIKPSSILLLLYCRYLLGLKTFIDVNDPLHLPEHLGRFAKIKFYLFLKIANGIVFESPEYQSYCRKFNIISAVIEDTPQFEISFINYKNREPEVVWFGSPETSKILLNYLEHLKAFTSYGYKITLLGAQIDIVNAIKDYGVKVNLIESYDHQLLVKTVSEASISFIPMPNTASYNLRGNLKLKLSMACGCIAVASNLPMHSRLVSSGINGYLFNDLEDFKDILAEIFADPKRALFRVGRLGNGNVVSEYSRSLHAKKICSFFDSCYE